MTAALETLEAHTPSLPTNAAMAGDRPRLDSLQVFRGVAALLVVLHHAGTFATGHLNGKFFGGALDWGAAGVDFFFVLSGFIIFFVHRSDLGRPARLGAFVTKRLIRIYPIYWVASAVLILLYFLSPAAGPTYARNPFAIFTSLALIPQGHFPILPQAWTLIFEMLFYGIFASLIWRWKIFLLPTLGWMTACAVIYALALTGEFMGHGNGRESLAFPWNWLLSRHNVLFGFGIMAAWLVMRGIGRRRHALLVWGGVILFATIAALNQPGSPFDLAVILDFPLTFGVASTIIVIGAAAADLADQSRRMPSWLLYIGNASYSIYLFHTIAMSLAVRPATRFVATGYLSVNAACLIMCVLAVAAGCLAHSWVERPLLAWLRRGSVGRRT